MSDIIQEPLPCPFCGSKAEIISYLDKYFTVKCDSELFDNIGKPLPKRKLCPCLPRTKHSYTKEQAIKAWNMRKQDIKQ